MDPFGFGSQVREQMEGLFVRGMEEMLRNQKVLQDVGRTVELGLEGKKAADTQIRQYLELMNIPTRDDVARILQYLQKIESRIADVEEKIDTVGDHVRLMSQALMMAGRAVAAREATPKEAPAPEAAASAPAEAAPAAPPAPVADPVEPVAEEAVGRATPVRKAAEKVEMPPASAPAESKPKAAAPKGRAAKAPATTKAPAAAVTPAVAKAPATAEAAPKRVAKKGKRS